MAKYNELDLCDVPWWEMLKTKEEKDEYCQETMGISYEEYLKEVVDPTMKLDPVTHKVRLMTPEEKEEFFKRFYGLTYAEWCEKYKNYTIEEIYNDLPNIKTP